MSTINTNRAEQTSDSIFIIQGEAERRDGIHYEVDYSVSPIGEGGMGRVYSGLQVNENTGVRMPVAIKFLYSDLPLSMIERVKREASIRIHNDNLVEMYGMVDVTTNDAAGTPTHHLHVISELLHGVMLHDLLQGRTQDVEGNEVPFAQELLSLYQNDKAAFAIKIVKNILSGIMALHDQGYIHRDIDPSNIMVTTDSKIKLIDFGIARQFGNLADDRPLTSAGTFIGKAEYAAPELVLGDINHQNETTDIYAIGIVLFQLATGHQPFTGPTNEVLYKQQHEKLPLGEIKDRRLRSIIETATEKLQKKRYQSAAEFRVALDTISRNTEPNENATAAGFNPYANAHTESSTFNEMAHSEGTQTMQPAAGGTTINDHATTPTNEIQAGGTMIQEGGSPKTGATKQPRPQDNASLFWIIATVGGLIAGALAGVFL